MQEKNIYGSSYSVDRKAGLTFSSRSELESYILVLSYNMMKDMNRDSGRSLLSNTNTVGLLYDEDIMHKSVLLECDKISFISFAVIGLSVQEIANLLQGAHYQYFSFTSPNP